MDLTTIAVGLAVLLWILALVKWAPGLFLSSSARDSASTAGSMLPKLFWGSHSLIAFGGLIHIALPGEWSGYIRGVLGFAGTIGLIAIAVHVEVIAEVEPYALRHAKVDEADRARYWTRSAWLFEKPIACLAAGVFLLGTTLHSLLIGGHGYLCVIGIMLLFSLWSVCRYTTLVVRNDRVTIHRYLKSDPTTTIQADAITSIHIHQPLIHRLRNVHRLTIESPTSHIRLTLADPTKAHHHLQKIAA